MPEQPAAERTEQPTPKRLEKARKQGQLPQGQELPSAAALIALTASVALLAPKLVHWFTWQTERAMSTRPDVFASNTTFMNFVRSIIIDSIGAVWPIMASLVVVSVLAGAAVSGLNFAPAALSVKWHLINPATGLSRLFSGRGLVRLLLSLVKLLFIGLIAWLYVRGRLDSFAALRWAWSSQILAATGKLVLGLMIRVGIALLVIGLADTFYQRYRYIQDLKMTRQEVKQERRDYEGSPEMRTRIRRIQLEMAMRRISTDVPKATVVLVNPTHVAVALRYESDSMEAPMVVAKGADHLAERIRQIARAYGVPVVRRPELARTIYSTVKVGALIPQSLYVAVAEVLALIYRLRRNKTKGAGR